MRIVSLGHGLFATAGAGLAILSFTYRDFAPIWQPLPGWIPWRQTWVYGSALLVMAASAGLCFPRTALASALTIGAYQAVWVVTRAVPVVFNPLSIGPWYGFCEALTPLLGAWILYAMLRWQSRATKTPLFVDERAVRAAQVLFGLNCVVYGLAHFAYADFTASMVPSWLPSRLGFAYFTGCAHIAAGIGIMLGVLPRVAATLEAMMMSMFGLLVWVPSLFAQPPPKWATPPQNQWSELVVTVLLAACAWIVATSIAKPPPGLHAERRPNSHFLRRPAAAARIINTENQMRSALSIWLIVIAAAIASLTWSHQTDARGVRLLPTTLGAARQSDVRAAGNAEKALPSPWTPLKNQPNFLVSGASLAMLLTDGTVLVQDTCATDWWRLTPDRYGSYVNGTWTQVASMPSNYAPFSNSSAVLPDGRLIIEGGEYNCAVDPVNPEWTALGAIYDPIANVWTPVAPPPFFAFTEASPGVYVQSIGDAQSVILADGTYMQADCCTKQSALLDAKGLTWTRTGKGKADPNDEEGWTLLPTGEVLTVDAYVPIPPFPYKPKGTNSEIYDPSTGAWTSAGSTVVQLWDSAAACGGENVGSFEVGPAVLRSDGTVFYTGSDTCPNGRGKTAIYDSYARTWTPGPKFPVVDGIADINIADGPASWEPNDKVLMMASPGYSNPPSFFFEWNGHDLTVVPGPPNASTEGSSNGNMLLLPTGQILFTDLSDDVEIYSPTITDHDEENERRIAPVIFSAPREIKRGGSYEISGIRFNGVTQGAAFGDDGQLATNFPLVRITQLITRHVFYGRTHDHSSMAVASDEEVSTQVEISTEQEPGPSLLQVVANGIASEPILVIVR